MGSDVDHKGITRDVLRCDVIIATQQEDHLRLMSGSLELETKLKSIDFALTAMEDVIAIPATLRVDELISRGYLLGCCEDGRSITAGQCIPTDDQ